TAITNVILPAVVGYFEAFCLKTAVNTCRNGTGCRRSKGEKRADEKAPNKVTAQKIFHRKLHGKVSLNTWTCLYQISTRRGEKLSRHESLLLLPPQRTPGAIPISCWCDCWSRRSLEVVSQPVPLRPFSQLSVLHPTQACAIRSQAQEIGCRLSCHAWTGKLGLTADSLSEIHALELQSCTPDFVPQR